MKAAVVRSDTTSRCTAFVARQTKMQMKASILTGFLVYPCLMVKGPAKSSPVLEKAG